MTKPILIANRQNKNNETFLRAAERVAGYLTVVWARRPAEREYGSANATNGENRDPRLDSSEVSEGYGARLEHRSLASRDQWPPQPFQAIEEKQPGRTHERLRLRHPDLGTMVVAKHLGCMEERAHVRLDASHAVSCAVQAVDLLYLGAGANALYTSCPAGAGIP
jgi:hypothetical protein